MSARSTPPEDVPSELERLVARIRARGAGEVLPRADPQALAALAAHLRDEKPMSETELQAHERMWRTVAEQMRAIDEADERADRRL